MRSTHLNGFHIFNFWMTTLLLDALIHTAYLSLMVGMNASYALQHFSSSILIGLVVYLPIFLSVLVVFLTSKRLETKARLKRLKTTYIIAFFIIYIAVIAFIFFTFYQTPGFYRKMGVGYMVNYSIDTLIYGLAVALTWIFTRRKLERTIPAASNHPDILDQEEM